VTYFECCSDGLAGGNVTGYCLQFDPQEKNSNMRRCKPTKSLEILPFYIKYREGSITIFVRVHLALSSVP